MADFVVALRKITEQCEYGAFLKDMLRDPLVCSIFDERVQQRFLRENNLIIKQAYDMALDQ